MFGSRIRLLGWFDMGSLLTHSAQSFYRYCSLVIQEFKISCTGIEDSSQNVSGIIKL